MDIQHMAKAQKPEPVPKNLPPGKETDLSQPITDVAPAKYDFAEGRRAIRSALATMSNGPGVYRMLDARGEVLYVGKAKNLKNRVQNYANAAGVPARILKMVGLTRSMELIATHTEVEALLLESNLIKRLKPSFNILLRDDKSFPFILLRRDHDWAQLCKHRGARNQKGQYFGPFASAGAVNRTLNILQKAFPLRSCSDSIFQNRTRPCLQYQIRRCTGPCVGKIESGKYADLVQEAQAFLSGKSREVQSRLSEAMTAASDGLDFETAAVYRDRLRALAHIQSHQGINVASVEDADIIAIHQNGGVSCIQVFFFRSGQNWGNRAFFPSHVKEHSAAEILASFIGQFYDDKPPPKEILCNVTPENSVLLAEALSLKAERKVRMHRPMRGARRDLLDQALFNARDALERRLSESTAQRKLLNALGELLGYDGTINRVEVYDNSHIQGSNAVGAMIVAGPDGFIKNGYRKFNIKDKTLTPGDDYAMMREVLNRRFSRLVKARESEFREEEIEDRPANLPSSEKITELEANNRIAGEWPDIVLIDGGQGQLSAAETVFEELGIEGIGLAAIAKGPDRNAGRERVFLPGRPPISPANRSAVMYFIQRLRDESHRYVIGTHRKKRAKGIGKSLLDEIAGIGPKRKRILLNHFGSAKQVEAAALADLQSLPGISRGVARKVYDHFHPEG